MAILGGVAVAALWLFSGIFSQTDDYTSARQDTEYVFQTIGRQFSNIGLGMPNNRSQEGTFAASFRGLGGSHPVMEQMGDRAGNNIEWGGPVALGKVNLGNVYDGSYMVQSTTTMPDGRDVYVGPELFYAWAVPTGVMVRAQRTDPLDAAKRTGWVGKVGTSQDITFEMLEPGGVASLIGFEYDRQPAGIVAGNGINMRSWIVFPTFRIPMLVRNIDAANNRIRVTVAPGSDSRHYNPLVLEGMLAGFEEIHMPQAARIYVRDNQLIQEIFRDNFLSASNSVRNVLARNVLAVYFKFDPEARLLTMYIAMRGSDPLPVGKKPGMPEKWPSFAASVLDSKDLRYRILVESMTWRIRN